MRTFVTVFDYLKMKKSFIDTCDNIRRQQFSIIFTSFYPSVLFSRYSISSTRGHDVVRARGTAARRCIMHTRAKPWCAYEGIWL